MKSCMDKINKIPLSNIYASQQLLTKLHNADFNGNILIKYRKGEIVLLRYVNSAVTPHQIENIQEQSKLFDDLLLFT